MTSLIFTENFYWSFYLSLACLWMLSANTSNLIFICHFHGSTNISFSNILHAGKYCFTVVFTIIIIIITTINLHIYIYKMCMHTHTHTHIYIYINIYHIKEKPFKMTHIFCNNIYFSRPIIFKKMLDLHLQTKKELIHIYIFDWTSQTFFVYIFFVNPFKLLNRSFDFRQELVDKPSIISYFSSTFCPTLGHHQRRMYYKRM